MCEKITRRAKVSISPLLICILTSLIVVTFGCQPATPSQAMPTGSPAGAESPTPPVAGATAPTGGAAGGASVPPLSAGDAARGESLFASKGCSSCHTIGGGTLVGPDLKGVNQRRDHDWLIKWITAPDQMIASGDPTAKQLVQQYGRQMPNLGVTPQEADDILAYIATK